MAFQMICEGRYGRFRNSRVHRSLHPAVFILFNHAVSCFKMKLKLLFSSPIICADVTYWQILLGVCNKNANLDVWSESDLDLEDQQVIKADVVRTRQCLAQFKTEQACRKSSRYLTQFLLIFVRLALFRSKKISKHYLQFIANGDLWSIRKA